MTDYYDAILGVIPISMVGVPGLLVGAGLELTVAVGAGATLALACIGHAMFVRTPAGTSDARPEGSRTDETPMNTAD